jgi:hypothetical protein
MRRAPRKALGRLKEFAIEWEMFYFAIWVVIGPHADVKDYVRWRSRIDYDPASLGHEDHTLAGLYFSVNRGNRGILWLASKPRTPEQVGFMVHELFHAVMDMARCKSFRMNSKTEETIAYALTYGVEQILEQVRNG